jgi:hypothetical protein
MARDQRIRRLNTVYIVAPLLLGIILLLYTIFASLLRVWLDHRVKLALLEKLQKDPNSPATLDEVAALLDGSSEESARKGKVDYTVVGFVLAAIGLASALSGYLWGHGPASAGIYFGGVACVAVGAILVLLGLLLRYLERLPIDTGMK